jgi:hypothetical protein
VTNAFTVIICVLISCESLSTELIFLQKKINSDKEISKTSDVLMIKHTELAELSLNNASSENSESNKSLCLSKD